MMPPGYDFSKPTFENYREDRMGPGSAGLCSASVASGLQNDNVLSSKAFEGCLLGAQVSMQLLFMCGACLSSEYTVRPHPALRWKASI